LAGVSADVRTQVKGKFIFVGDEKLYLRGVTYGPVRPKDAGECYPELPVVQRDFAALPSTIQLCGWSWHSVKTPTGGRRLKQLRTSTHTPSRTCSLVAITEVGAGVGLDVAGGLAVGIGVAETTSRRRADPRFSKQAPETRAASRVSTR